MKGLLNPTNVKIPPPPPPKSSKSCLPGIHSLVQESIHSTSWDLTDMKLWAWTSEWATPHFPWETCVTCDGTTRWQNIDSCHIRHRRPYLWYYYTGLFVNITGILGQPVIMLLVVRFPKLGTCATNCRTTSTPIAITPICNIPIDSLLPWR